MPEFKLCDSIIKRAVTNFKAMKSNDFTRSFIYLLEIAFEIIQSIQTEILFEQESYKNLFGK